MTAASGDLEAAGPARQGCIDLLFRDIDLAQDAAGQIRRLDAERGESDAGGQALEQPASELFLNLGDDAGEHRLGDSKFVGRDENRTRRIAEEIPQTCTPDTRWRYRDAFVEGRDNIVPFLRTRWPLQEHYRLRKELWSFTACRISVRFISEWRHRDTGQWYRTYGSEHREFAPGLQSVLDLSANDIPIDESERSL